MGKKSIAGKLFLLALGGAAIKMMVDKHPDDEEEDFESFLRTSQKDLQKECKETLRRHLGKQIVFTGIFSDAQKSELDKDELAEGEDTAFISQVGCYSVRESYSWEENPGYEKETQIQEISVKHCMLNEQRESDAEYKNVCSATKDPYARWTEEILFICAVKKDGVTPDEEAALFVLVKYIGDSFSCNSWYKMTRDGSVTVYEENVCDTDAVQEAWQI